VEKVFLEEEHEEPLPQKQNKTKNKTKKQKQIVPPRQHDAYVTLA